MDTGSADSKAPYPTPDKPEPFPKEITLKYDVTPINNLIHAINEHNNAQQIGNNGGDGIGDGQPHPQHEANRISRISMYVSCALGGFTIVALLLNAWAVHEATRAADAADSTVSIYRASMKWDSTKDAKASFADSVRFQKQFDLNKNTADSQIRIMQGTLAETRKQFGIEKMPYLQMTHPTMDTLEEGRPFTITFTIENFGNYPAKILDYRMMGGAYDKPITEKQIKEYDSGFTSKDTFLMNTYVIKESPLKGRYGDTVALTKDQINIIKILKLRTYLIGYFRYQNLITKQVLLYRFTIEIECKTGGGATFWFNANKPLSPREAKKPTHLEIWK